MDEIQFVIDRLGRCWGFDEQNNIECFFMLTRDIGLVWIRLVTKAECPIEK
jgi:hypothetical protein